jgi:hypothetical protein
MGRRIEQEPKGGGFVGRFRRGSKLESYRRSARMNADLCALRLLRAGPTGGKEEIISISYPALAFG